MSIDFENLIEARFDAKTALRKAQCELEMASDKLLRACIEKGDATFLKLDETALERYYGNSRR